MSMAMLSTTSNLEPCWSLCPASSYDTQELFVRLNKDNEEMFKKTVPFLGPKL